MRVYRIPLSTNVERVALGLGYKGLDVEWIDVPCDDRSEVVRVSGQELVPVLDDDGLILPDSVAILRYVEERRPGAAAVAARAGRRAEAEISSTGSTAVEAAAEPHRGRLRRGEYGPRITASLDRSSDLDGRYLFGDVGIADVIAFRSSSTRSTRSRRPRIPPVLRDWQPIEGRPHVEAWIAA